MADFYIRAQPIQTEVLEKFRSKIPERLAGISEAVAQGDADRVSKAAHKLKGGASTFGALRLAELCRQMEMIGKSGKLPDDDGLLSAIGTECHRVRTAIGKML